MSYNIDHFEVVLFAISTIIRANGTITMLARIEQLLEKGTLMLTFASAHRRINYRIIKISLPDDYRKTVCDSLK